MEAQPVYRRKTLEESAQESYPTPEELAAKKAEFAEQITTTFNVAVNSCETFDELSELQAFAIALNGIILGRKDREKK